MKYDVILIGAGPIGIEMAAVLRRAGISCLHVEKGAIASTIARWPRNTRFFSSPEWIAVAGIPIQTAGQEIITGEDYLAYLRHVVETLGLEIHTYQEVLSITGGKDDFTVSTEDNTGTRREYFARRIILATGDMNSPRKIDIPGEDLSHVTHLWTDPHYYFQRDLLIVGGRNSAVEAAIRCWRAGARVTISYRGDSLDERRLISRLWLEVDLLVRNGRITFHPRTEPVEIKRGVTVLRRLDGYAGSDQMTVPADFVYLATGFTMDRSLYEQCGISMEGDERRPVVQPETMESDVPGVYVVGTAQGGDQRGYKVFITTSHDHCLKAARAIASSLGIGAAISDKWVGNLPSRDYPLTSGDVE